MRALIYFLILIKVVLGLNYGQQVQRLYLPPAEAFIQRINPLKPSDNSTLAIPNSPRRMGTPYTIFYPLTFPQNRNGKALNLTLAAATNQVQSRIINKPEVYPSFGFYSPPSPPKNDGGGGAPPAVQGIADERYNAPNPSYEYNGVKNLVIPSQYYANTINFQDADLAYYNKSSGSSGLIKSPKDIKPSNIKYVPSLGYGKYPPLSNYQLPLSVKPINSQQIFPPLRTVKKSSEPPVPIKQNQQNDVDAQPPIINQPSKPVFPIPGRGENPPVYQPPISAYKKQSESPPVPRLQQYTSCICVPYYLCKDGVLNSGGRLQDTRKRRARATNYITKNKTTAAIQYQSNIVNLYADDRNNPDKSLCEPTKVCCQVYFSDVTDGNDDAYPVATPPPEQPIYPHPPRFPSQSANSPSCGLRQVYGMKTRLKEVQYSADVAEFGEYPWQIAILKKVNGDKNLYLCGGVLIAPQWIATVAHCVNKNKDSPLLIRLGEWDVNRKDETYPYIEKDVNRMVIHPDFDSESLQSDLALLRMSDPINPSVPHITPACLPTPGQVYENQKCWVSGWGKNFFGPKGEYQNVLKEVDVPVVSRALCSAELRSTKLGPDFVLHPGFLCAGGEMGKDACTGDGGSPLVCKSEGNWYVVGLVSWGIGCGQAGIPGVYVNVLYYADWINSITRN